MSVVFHIVAGRINASNGACFALSDAGLFWAGPTHWVSPALVEPRVSLICQPLNSLFLNLVHTGVSSADGYR